KMQVEALKAPLGEASNELKAVERRSDVERALSNKESELANLMIQLNEQSTLADVQKIEIIALKTEIEALKGRLDGASNEWKAVEERGKSESLELEEATDKLMDERRKFEDFHRRVSKLVQQLVVQGIEDKILSRRLQELENRLVEQSQQLNE